MAGSGTIDADLAIVDGSFEVRNVNGEKSAAPVQPGGLPYWSFWGDGRISLGETDSIGTILDVNRLATSLDPVQNDVFLKMDFDGTVMSLTAWEARSEMPLEPQLTYEDSTLTSGTVAMLAFGQGDLAFRSFAISPIPEPSGIVLCSFVLLSLAIGRPRRI